MRYIILYLFLAVALAAADSLKQEVATAAAIPNNVERLAAYDAIAVRHKLVPGPVAAGAKAGKWQISTTISPLDDSKTIVGRLEADSVNAAGHSVALLIRYEEGKLDAYIAYDLPLGLNRASDTVISARFGQEPAVTQRWDLSTELKSAFVRTDVGPFVKKLSTVDSLLLRFTPQNSTPVTAIFNPSGVQIVMDAINQVVAETKGK